MRSRARLSPYTAAETRPLSEAATVRSSKSGCDLGLPRKPGEGDLTVGEPSGGGQYSGGFTGSEVRLLVPSNESFRSFVDRGMGSDLETLT